MNGNYEMSASQCVRHTPPSIADVAMAGQCRILFSGEAAGQRFSSDLVGSQDGYSPGCDTVSHKQAADKGM